MTKLTEIRALDIQDANPTEYSKYKTTRSTILHPDAPCDQCINLKTIDLRPRDESDNYMICIRTNTMICWPEDRTADYAMAWTHRYMTQVPDLDPEWTPTVHFWNQIASLPIALYRMKHRILT